MWSYFLKFRSFDVESIFKCSLLHGAQVVLHILHKYFPFCIIMKTIQYIRVIFSVISNFSLNWRLYRRNKLITKDHHQYEPHLVQIRKTYEIIHPLLMLWLYCPLKRRINSFILKKRRKKKKGRKRRKMRSRRGGQKEEGEEVHLIMYNCF